MLLDSLHKQAGGGESLKLAHTCVRKPLLLTSAPQACSLHVLPCTPACNGGTHLGMRAIRCCCMRAAPLRASCSSAEAAANATCTASGRGWTHRVGGCCCCPAVSQVRGRGSQPGLMLSHLLRQHKTSSPLRHRIACEHSVPRPFWVLLLTLVAGAALHTPPMHPQPTRTLLHIPIRILVILGSLLLPVTPPPCVSGAPPHVSLHCPRHRSWRRCCLHPPLPRKHLLLWLLLAWAPVPGLHAGARLMLGDPRGVMMGAKGWCAWRGGPGGREGRRRQGWARVRGVRAV